MRTITSLCILAGLLMAQTDAASPGCSCGYRLTKYGNAYFPYSKTIDFTQLKSLDDLNGQELSYNIDWQMGAASEDDGTICVGKASNYRFTGAKNGLELVVPGGQTAGPGKKVTGAEIFFQKDILYGVMTANMKLESTPGTCQSIFTYASDHEKHGDEQDIEALSASLLTASSINPPGIQLTNYDPKDPSGGTSDFKINKFPFDPTQGFHDYTIAWLPGNTTYFLDNFKSPAPPKFSSVNPSQVLINHWTTGQKTFTQGPPKTETVLSLKKLTIYYATKDQRWRPNKSCREVDYCKV